MAHSSTTDVLVVGAGLAGSVVAERLASAGLAIEVVERKPHVGGLAFDELDEHGVLVHRYGAHIFHTNDAAAFDYLKRFTGWRQYEHRVLAYVDGQLLPIPINRNTINKLYGLYLDEAGARAFLESVRDARAITRTSEDVVLDAVGADLYEKFFRGYTLKQWGRDPSELDAEVTSRIPVRADTEDRYFRDTYQGLPEHGYTRMVERMLSHPKVNVHLGVDFADLRHQVRARHIVYTGPIDAYFGYCLGRLPYRSLRFESKHLPLEQFQPVAVVNYPSTEVEYTRIIEHKHMTGQEHPCTSITIEYPSEHGEPFYPVPSSESKATAEQYRALATNERRVSFVGRLAQYRYLNMDQVILSALEESEAILARL